jgi:hypothetical protein
MLASEQPFGEPILIYTHLGTKLGWGARKPAKLTGPSEICAQHVCNISPIMVQVCVPALESPPGMFVSVCVCVCVCVCVNSCNHTDDGGLTIHKQIVINNNRAGRSSGHDQAGRSSNNRARSPQGEHPRGERGCSGAQNY